MVKPGLPYLDIIKKIKENFKKYQYFPIKFPGNTVY